MSPNSRPFRYRITLVVFVHHCSLLSREAKVWQVVKDVCYSAVCRSVHFCAAPWCGESKA